MQEGGAVQDVPQPCARTTATLQPLTLGNVLRGISGTHPLPILSTLKSADTAGCASTLDQLESQDTGAAHVCIK